MKRLIWILLLLSACGVPPESEAAVGTTGVETWYYRPASSCANNGDGLAYNCAASPGSSGAFRENAGSTNIIWTATTGVDDGDTLYICGAHTQEFVIFPTAAAGSAGAPIRINFNCPGDRGSITQVTTMPEALIAGNWTNESAGVWYLSLASYNIENPVRLWMNGVEQFRASVKVNLGTIENTTPSVLSTWWFDSGASRLYVFSSSNPSTGLTSMQSLVTNTDECASFAMCIIGAGHAHFEIIDPILRGGNLQTLHIRGATDIKVLGTSDDDSACRIGDIGPTAISLSDSNNNGTGTSAERITIRNCTLDQGYPAYWGGALWEWPSHDGVFIRSGVTSSLIESNTFLDWTHNGIAIDATAGTASVTNVAMKDNVFSFRSGMGYGRAIGVDGAADGRATGNRFLSNVTTGQAIQSQFNGNGNFMIGNVWRDAQPTTVIGKERFVPYVQVYGYAGTSNNNVYANNSFINNKHTACLAFEADAISAVMSGHIVRNNIFYNCGGTADASYPNVAMKIPSSANVGNNTFQNNLIYSDNNSTTVFYKGSGAVTVSAFQSACSGDVCSGNSGSDPMLVSAGSGITKSSSPARLAGIFYHGCIDVRGRICNSPPDIGAYQASSGDQASTRTVRQ